MRFQQALSAAVLVAWAATASAQERAAEQSGEGTTAAEAHGAEESGIARANDPIAGGLFMNDYYSSRLYGSSATANVLQFQGIYAYKLGAPQLVRLSVPFSTQPNPETGEQRSGIGDVNLFHLVVIPADRQLRFALGPQATFPTAISPVSFSFLGTGKWQLGAVGAVIWTPAPDVLFGALVGWQTSIAGPSSRTDTDQAIARPFLFLKMGGGFYMRSSASWIFDLVSGKYYIPFGVGAGKVVKFDRSVINMFIEPAFTILHQGDGVPELQILTGINWQIH